MKALRDRSRSVPETDSKIDLKVDAQKEANRRPYGSQSRVKKSKHEATFRRGLGAPQGRPWEPPGPILDSFLASFGVSICKNCVLLGCHFEFTFGVFLKCIVGDSRTIHGVGNLRRTSEIGSRERSPCVRKRFGSRSRPISGRPARQRFTQRDHTRPLRSSACMCTGSH